MARYGAVQFPLHTVRAQRDAAYWRNPVCRTAASWPGSNMATYFDDFQAGLVERYGHYVVTRDEVISFARQYDPQPFHLDDAAAARTFFGKVAASGWHTGAMAMRMMVDHWTRTDRKSLGSPGLDEVRWLKPVYPGDSLRIEDEWLELRASSSRPERGTARVRTTVYNQHDEPVMRFVGLVMLARRPPAG